MNKNNLKKLQQRAQKLLELSSEEDYQFENEQSFPPKQSRRTEDLERYQTDPQLIKKCLKLTCENGELRSHLRKEKQRNQQLSSKVSNLNKVNQQARAVMEKQLQGYIKLEKQKLERETARQVSLIQQQLDREQVKTRNLEALLEEEIKKSKTLGRFIRKQLPQLQQNLLSLTAKVQNNLEGHLLRDLHY